MATAVAAALAMGAAACGDDDEGGLQLDQSAEVDREPAATVPVGDAAGGVVPNTAGRVTATVDGVTYELATSLCQATGTALIADAAGALPDGGSARISVNRRAAGEGDDVTVTVVVGAGSPTWVVSSASSPGEVDVTPTDTGLTGSGPAVDLSDPAAADVTTPMSFEVECG